MRRVAGVSTALVGCWPLSLTGGVILGAAVTCSADTARCPGTGSSSGTARWLAAPLAGDSDCTQTGAIHGRASCQTGSTLQ